MDGAVVEGGTEREHDAGAAGREVHRQPHELITREGEVTAIGQRVPAEAADVRSDDRIAARVPGRMRPTEVEDHAGPAVEQARLPVELTLGCTADQVGGAREALVLPPCQVIVQDEADADAAVGEVGHRPPALVDLEWAVGGRDAAP